MQRHSSRSQLQLCTPQLQVCRSSRSLRRNSRSQLPLCLRAGLWAVRPQRVSLVSSSRPKPPLAKRGQMAPSRRRRLGKTQRSPAPTVMKMTTRIAKRIQS